MSGMEVALAVAAGAGFIADLEHFCKVFYQNRKRFKEFKPSLDDLDCALKTLVLMLRQLQDARIEIPSHLREALEKDIADGRECFDEMSKASGIGHALKKGTSYEGRINKAKKDIDRHVTLLNCVLSSNTMRQTSEMKGEVTEVNLNIKKVMEMMKESRRLHPHPEDKDKEKDEVEDKDEYEYENDFERAIILVSDDEEPEADEAEEGEARAECIYGFEDFLYVWCNVNLKLKRLTEFDIPRLKMKPFICNCIPNCITLASWLAKNGEQISCLPMDIKLELRSLLTVWVEEISKCKRIPFWRLVKLSKAEKLITRWEDRILNLLVLDPETVNALLEPLNLLVLVPETVNALLEPEGISSLELQICHMHLSKSSLVATVMSKTHADGSLPSEINTLLIDLSGKEAQMRNETNLRAVRRGLMFHDKAKQLMKAQNYQDALELLTKGEEAFSHGHPTVMELVDNVYMLQIDIVWCYLKLGDIPRLSAAGIQLSQARKGLELANEKDTFRVRRLQMGGYLARALYLRLQLLEGVVAFHIGEVDKAMELLTSAQEKFNQLQVADESLSRMMEMGFGERDAKLALRICNQDVSRAAYFLDAHFANIRKDIQIKEQEKYALEKGVDWKSLNYLVDYRFAKDLAAEALLRNKHDNVKALNELREANVQLPFKTIRPDRGRSVSLQQLAQMRFEGSLVVEAGATMEEGIKLLKHQQSIAADNLIAYDFEVTEEGISIREYLALLNSGEKI